MLDHEWLAECRHRLSLLDSVIESLDKGPIVSPAVGLASPRIVHYQLGMPKRPGPELCSCGCGAPLIPRDYDTGRDGFIRGHTVT